MIRAGLLRRIVLSAFVVLSLSLAACATQAPSRSYAVGGDSVAEGQSDRESCLRSCNESFDRCSDSTAAQRPISPDVPSDLFGARSSCRDALRDCLPRCKGR